jgi:ribosomal-protein-serine acetyltransferase
MVTIPVDAGLSLVQLQAEDAEELFRLTDENRAHLRRWLPWLDRTRVPAATAAFIDFTLRAAEAGTGLHCAIEEHGRIVGVCGYNHVDAANRSAQIGYWLDAGAQGRGLMSRSVTALASYGFARLDLHRQAIACAEGNLASAAVAARCGFRFEGVARDAEWLYDHFVHHRLFSRLRTDA